MAASGPCCRRYVGLAEVAYAQPYRRRSMRRSKKVTTKSNSQEYMAACTLKKGTTIEIRNTSGMAKPRVRLP